jgi:hypothetical protein
MSQALQDQFISRILTSSDLARLVEELNLLLVCAYDTDNVKAEQVLDRDMRVWVADVLRPVWESAAVGEEREKQVKALMAEVTSMPKAEVTLAVEPSGKVTSALVLQLRQMTGKPLLVDFRYEPRMIGGLKLAFEGKYFEWTVEQVFEQRVKGLEEQVTNN